MDRILRLQHLFELYFNGTSSSDEKAELASLVESEDNETLTGILKDLWAQPEVKEPEPILTAVEAEDILQEILHSRPGSVPVIRIIKSNWFRIAAASVILMMATGTYFLLNSGQKQQKIASNQVAANDLPPGGNKAVLTLADGTKIILDNAANGNLANQGNARVIKLDEQIVYKASGNNSEVYYNTISTPRGGVYQLVLADGSKVWLNSSSSLHYPTSFAGRERKVEITGEAYFEVARNSSMPFKINIAGKEEVEVLGTHFNINAYPDEPAINTTLLEGSVKITDLADHNSSYIAPGQQAQLGSNGKIRLISNPDIEAVVAWKNGSFIFNSQNIGDIMRQVGRWYDVDISYSGEISHETYSGIVSRNNNVSVVLKIMEEGGVKFRIEGKKIIVLH